MLLICIYSLICSDTTSQIRKTEVRGLQGVNKTIAPLLHSKLTGSPTFGNAGAALPSHYHNFFNKNSPTNACTTKCKIPVRYTTTKCKIPLKYTTNKCKIPLRYTTNKYKIPLRYTTNCKSSVSVVLTSYRHKQAIGPQRRLVCTR